MLSIDHNNFVFLYSRFDRIPFLRQDSIYRKWSFGVVHTTMHLITWLCGHICQIKNLQQKEPQNSPPHDRSICQIGLHEGGLHERDTCP